MSRVQEIRVPSESTPGREYVLHALEDTVVCNCVGFSTHGHCKHAEKVRAAMAESTAIVKSDAPPAAIVAQAPPTALLPTRDELTLMTAIAEQATKATGVVPHNIKTKEQAVAVMMAGWELGLRPMTALRHVYVVNGKTDIETRAMVGIIKARRPDIQISWPEYTAEAVTCEIRRPGQPITSVRYSKEDAQRSGQLDKKAAEWRDGKRVEVSGPWQRYTRDMLYAAATKRAARLACPDIINGIETSMHTVDEAASLIMPDAEVRVINDPPAIDAIPGDAYNDGDDPAEYREEPIDAAEDDEAPPAPPEPAPIPVGARINRTLRDIADTWDNDAKAKIRARIDAQFPGAISPSGQLMIGKLDAAQQDQLWAWLQRLIGGARDAQAEAGKLPLDD